jgi:cytochrome b
VPRQIPVGDAPLSERPAAEQRVWDLPIRLFHWTLAALIAFSWWSVKYHHTDWHIWSGIAILTLVVFRLLWGLFGSSTARFASFVRGPTAVLRYLRGEWRGMGHTPLGALSIIALLADAALQVGLGLFAEDPDGIYAGPLAPFVSSNTSDAIRDWHEANSYVLLSLIGLHIGAIIVFRLQGRHLTKPMITGRAVIEPGAEPMRPVKWWVAVLCLAAALAVARWGVAGAPPFGS